MGWFCCIPDCSKRSDRDKDMSFHRSPPHNKKLLKIWIYKIGRKNLPLSTSTRVCSRYFIQSKNRKLRPDEYPMLNLPVLATQVTQPRKRRSPKKRGVQLPTEKDSSSENSDDSPEPTNSVTTSTDVTGKDIEALETECEQLKRSLEENQAKFKAAEFQVDSIKHGDKQLHYYTGFSSYRIFKACFDFLGSAAS